ncbi:hypothetical protein Tco_0468529 [Tanacetum coccineum]
MAWINKWYRAFLCFENFDTISNGVENTSEQCFAKLPMSQNSAADMRCWEIRNQTYFSDPELCVNGEVHREEGIHTGIPIPVTHHTETDSEVTNEKSCSKSCLKNYEALKKQYNDLLVKLDDTDFKAATYKRGKGGLNAVKASACWNNSQLNDKGFIEYGSQATLTRNIAPYNHILKTLMEVMLLLVEEQMEAELLQRCGTKELFLFTDSECLAASPIFKLLDETQILHKIPRLDNMYNVLI